MLHVNTTDARQVHWDHVGEPRDFPSSRFVVGSGSLDVLLGKGSSLRGGHSFFEADLLDLARTVQLSDPKKNTLCDDSVAAPSSSEESVSFIDFSRPWRPLGSLPSTLDLFGDGTVYVVDAPGHLPGHINLIVRGKDDEWVYLAGDSCHDRRIMRNEKEIGEWLDGEGHKCCIHADRAEAEETIRRIRELERKGVEVIFAHDVEWESNAKNLNRFFGASQGLRARMVHDKIPVHI